MTRVESSSRPQQPRSYDQWMFRQSDDTEDQVSAYYLDDQNYTYPPPYSDNPPPAYDANPASRSHHPRRPWHTHQTPTIRQQIPMKNSFTSHIILSCFAIWLCGVLLGLIAFFVAVTASSKASNGDQQRARDLGNVSYSLSMFAISVGVLAWVLVVLLLAII